VCRPQHEGGNLISDSLGTPPCNLSLAIPHNTQGNDGLLPGFTPVYKQNPDTLASSASLLNGLSVPWENDRPWSRCLLIGLLEGCGVGGAFTFKDREDTTVVLGDDGREDDDGSNIFATKLVHRRKEDEGRL